MRLADDIGRGWGLGNGEWGMGNGDIAADTYESSEYIVASFRPQGEI